MATTRQLPPARFYMIPPQEGLTQRVRGRENGGVAHQAKRYGGARLGQVDPQLPGFQYRTLDFLQINPAHEQPRLVYNSGAQPIIRWGWRRYVRTFMTASARFSGRWFYAGYIQNQFVVRGRVTGAPQRLGTSYSVPRFISGPRVIPLG